MTIWEEVKRIKECEWGWSHILVYRSGRLHRHGHIWHGPWKINIISLGIYLDQQQEKECRDEEMRLASRSARNDHAVDGNVKTYLTIYTKWEQRARGEPQWDWRGQDHQVVGRSWNRSKWSLFQESRLRNIAEAHQGHNYMHCLVCAAKSEIKSNEGIHMYLKFIEQVYFPTIKGLRFSSHKLCKKKRISSPW